MVKSMYYSNTIANEREREAMAMQNQYSDDHKKLPGKRPRLMIDIDPELRRRIKIAAAQKDLSIREYVEDILDQAVPTEDAHMKKRQPHSASLASLQRLLRTREQIIQERQGQPFTDSTEIIRQMREERSEYLGEL
jgi:plasmid stability protein